MFHWPWKKRVVPSSESRRAVEVTQRAYHETIARQGEVQRVTEQAKLRAMEAKEQHRRNRIAPTFQAAFEMSRKKPSA